MRQERTRRKEERKKKKKRLVGGERDKINYDMIHGGQKKKMIS